jgi:hypothetical protein
MLRSRFALFALALTLLPTLACSGAREESSPNAEGALGADGKEAKRDLSEFFYVAGTTGDVAEGDKADRLFDVLKANGARMVDDHTILAGFTAKELGLANLDPKLPDVWGLTCVRASEQKPSFCRLNVAFHRANIANDTSEGRDDRTRTQYLLIDGKLAPAIRSALPKQDGHELWGMDNSFYGDDTTVTWCQFDLDHDVACYFNVRGAVKRIVDAPSGGAGDAREPAGTFSRATAQAVLQALAPKCFEGNCYK